FEPPADFAGTSLDLPPFVQGENPVTARVLFGPSAAWWVRRSYGWMKFEEQTDSGAIASIDVTDAQGFVSWALGFGEAAEILEPPDLRKRAEERLALICN
ncbi:MAG: helix-turn-helix transcriptional regulator, partial [Actinomycetota bacterium]